MSLAKTSIQITIAEGATEELIGTFMQFIIKYHNNTGLGINQTSLTSLEQSNVLQKSFTNMEIYNNQQQLLDNFPEVTNPEYHKAKEHPPKRYKSSVEVISSSVVKPKESVFKSCSYV